jgi:hypothetical protein
MDVRADSPAPFELLLNMCPTDEGWQQRPGTALEHQPTTTIRFVAAGTFRFNERLVAVALGFKENGTGYLWVGDDRGRTLYGATLTHDCLSGHYSNSADDFWSCVSMGNRLFFSNCPQRPPFVVAQQLAGLSDDLVAIPLNNGEWLQVGSWAWTSGVDAENWPYLTGDVSGRVLCAHLDRIFMAGFNDNQVVGFDGTIPPEQTIVAGLTVSDDSLFVNRQTLAWTDPANPRAVRFPNWLKVGTAHAITALVSWRDRLFIFTDNDLWVLTGMLEEEFVLRPIATGIGCSGKQAVCVAPEGVFFAHSSGIYATDGGAVERISDPIEHLFETGYFLPSTAYTTEINDVGAPLQFEREWGQAAYIGRQREVWFPVARRQTGHHHYALVYRISKRAWWVASADRHYNGVAGKTNSAITRVTGDTVASPLGTANKALKGTLGGYAAAGVVENDVVTIINSNTTARVKSLCADPVLNLKSWPLVAVGNNFKIESPGLNCYANGYRLIVPMGSETLMFGWDENYYTDVVCRWHDYGGMLRPIYSGSTAVSGRSRIPFLMVTKPLLTQRSTEVYAQHIILNWRRPPNGTTVDRGGEAGTCKAYLWGAEAPWGANAQTIVGDVRPYPLYLTGQQKWDGADWGTGATALLYTKREGIVQQLPLDVRSRYVRLAIWGFGTTRAVLRGVSILFMQAVPTGGRADG